MTKFNLVHLFVLVSVANFMNAQDMESVLEVGRENQVNHEEKNARPIY